MMRTTMWIACAAVGLGCGGAHGSPEPELVGSIQSASEAGVQPESGNTAPGDASPTETGPCLHPHNSPFVEAGGGCLVEGTLPIGSSCTSDAQCEPSSYVGPLLLSWGCYPNPGGSGSVCAFRCDDVSGSDADAGDGGLGNDQVSAEQPSNIPAVCPQLGGRCVADPSLPATNGVFGARFTGTPSLCVVP